MARKLVTILIAAVATAIMLFAGGCGGDDEPKAGNGSPQDMLRNAGNGGEDLNARIKELEKTPMTVEIIQNGDPEGKWSQDGKGSWRWQSSADERSYMIFNAEQNKFWNVSGDTATESSGEAADSFQGFNPAVMMSGFTAMTYLPRTGGSDDAWEWDVPGQGKLIIEFKGPDGMFSKLTSEDATTGDTDVTEFKYSDVGDVPDSTFELPSGVTVQSMDSTGLGTVTGDDTTSTDSFDDTVSVPNGGYNSGDGLYE
jgi:hypothetical protein